MNKNVKKVKLTYLFCTATLKWHSQLIVTTTIAVEFTRTRAIVIRVTDTAKRFRKVDLHNHLARFA